MVDGIAVIPMPHVPVAPIQDSLHAPATRATMAMDCGEAVGVSILYVFCTLTHTNIYILQKLG